MDRVNAADSQMLSDALAAHGANEVASMLEVDPAEVIAWSEGHKRIPSQKLSVLRGFALVPQAIARPRTKAKGKAEGFAFIDLFAGIGGMRLGFERAGGRCVFTSEWNKYAQQTYRQNFKSDHNLAGDITKIDAEDVPDHDVLLAGFPCQPFSIAGVSKKNALGRKHGFEDETQGTLFFDVARIIKAKQPQAFLLENVKNLVSHDKGNTFRVICRALREELGYQVHTKVVDARHFVPQHRERILIVGFREGADFSFDDLVLPEQGPLMASILHPEDGSEAADGRFTIGPKAKVNEKYVLTDHLWRYLQDYAAKHQAKGNGFGFGLVTGERVARTLSARYYKDGSEILVARGRNRNPRRLTPRECARLMGFPDTFDLNGVSDTQLYKQFGNSVAVPVIAEVARLMAEKLQRQKREQAGVRLIKHSFEMA
jgi:DNA (cytosine-5)-methyltransferase 1